MKKIVAMALVLTGCSSYTPEKVSQINTLMAQGRCSEAAAVINQTDSPNNFNNLGVVAENCEKDREKARRYYEYAARTGNQTAVQNLLRNGWSVPSPDVRAQTEAERQAGMNLGLQLLQAGQPKPARTVTCDTDKFGNGLQTTCR